MKGDWEKDLGLEKSHTDLNSGFASVLVYCLDVLSQCVLV